MLTIYGVYQSRASRSYWMALELGLDYESVPVIQARLLADAEAPDAPVNTHSPAFLRINPNGQIPTIDDDGLILWESAAINLHLARKHGGPLSAENGAEQAEIDKWSFWGVAEVEPHTVKIVLTHDNQLADTEGGRETIAVSTRLLRRPLGILETHLQSRDYLLGARFTVADLNLAEILRYAMSERDFLAHYPRVVAWLERCHDRPAFKRMMELRSAE